MHLTPHGTLACYINYRNCTSSLIKLISSFVSNIKFSVMIEGELSTPWNIQAGVPQGSVLSPTLYSLYINHTLQTPGVYLALFVDDTCLYSTDRKECYVLRKLQRDLTSIESWCERWTLRLMKIRPRPSTSPIDTQQSKLFLRWKDGKLLS
jgi:hypothetical protein